MVLAALVAACAQWPRVPQPTSWPWHPHGSVAVGPTRPGSPEGQPRWWRVLGSRALDVAVASALRGNPSLVEAAARARVARAELRLTRGAGRLHVSAIGRTMADHFSRDGLHGPVNGQSILYGEVDPVVGRWHVTGFGRVNDEVRAAFGVAQAAKADRAWARLLVAAQVARIYFAAEAMRDQAACWAAIRHDARELLGLARMRRRYGLSGARPLYGAEQALDGADQGYRQAATTLIHLRDALGAVAGRGPAFGRGVTLGTLPGAVRLPLPVTLPLALVARRPDVESARKLVAAAAARVGAARAAFYPDINIAFFAGWNSISLADLFDPANLARAIGPTVTLPIFEGGTLRAGLAKEKAAFTEARAQYQGTLVDAVREVADRVARWRRVSRDLRSEAQALHAAWRQRALAEQAFRAGLTNRIPLLQADWAWRRERLRAIALRETQVVTWVDIEEAIDGQAG